MRGWLERRLILLAILANLAAGSLASAAEGNETAPSPTPSGPEHPQHIRRVVSGRYRESFLEMIRLLSATVGQPLSPDSSDEVHTDFVGSLVQHATPHIQASWAKITRRDGFHIDPQCSGGICQANAVVSAEILDEAGKQAGDELIVYAFLLLRPANSDLHKAFGPKDLEANLNAFGYQFHFNDVPGKKVDHSDKAKDKQLWRLLAMLQAEYRRFIIVRLIGPEIEAETGEKVGLYMRVDESLVLDPKLPWYSMLMRRVFERMQRFQIAFAFYDGLPTQAGIQSLSGACHLAAADYDSEQEKWVFAWIPVPYPTLESNGCSYNFALVHRNDGGRHSMNAEVDSDFFQWTYRETLLPRQGKHGPVIVVHLSGILPSMPPLGQRFEMGAIKRLALDQVDVMQLFENSLNGLPYHLPTGQLWPFSIVHFSTIEYAYRLVPDASWGLQVFPLKYAQFSWIKDSDSHAPFEVFLLADEPSLGVRQSLRNGFLILGNMDGRRFVLRLWRDPMSRVIDFEQSYFAVGGEARGVAQPKQFPRHLPATILEWGRFLHKFRAYFNSDMAVAVRSELGRTGFPWEKLDWDSPIPNALPAAGYPTLPAMADWNRQKGLIAALGAKLIENWELIASDETTGIHLGVRRMRMRELLEGAVQSSVANSASVADQIATIGRDRQLFLRIDRIHLNPGQGARSCRIIPVEGDGDCGLNALPLGLSRADYIRMIVATYQAEMREEKGNERLRALLRDLLEQRGVTTIEEWARLFQDRRNPRNWLAEADFRLLSLLYGIRFLFFIEAPFFSHANPGLNSLIPSPDCPMIDEVVGESYGDVHLAWSNYNHFDSIQLLPDAAPDTHLPGAEGPLIAPPPPDPAIYAVGSDPALPVLIETIEQALKLWVIPTGLAEIYLTLNNRYKFH